MFTIIKKLIYSKIRKNMMFLATELNKKMTDKCLSLTNSSLTEMHLGRELTFEKDPFAARWSMVVHRNLQTKTCVKRLGATEASVIYHKRFGLHSRISMESDIYAICPHTFYNAADEITILRVEIRGSVRLRHRGSRGTSTSAFENPGGS